SRTYQYRKVMKPLLERKRRARINKCLDHLKDLMVGALPKDCESITKLEKADVLELTVDHLKKLKHYNALALPAESQSHEKFNSGFRQCASEVSRFIKSEPGIDVHVASRLLGHLGGCMT
ncbi:Myc-type basic helix-loop-helix (bHLH) domain, partial [Trinorchestia longiramus]